MRTAVSRTSTSIALGIKPGPLMTWLRLIERATNSRPVSAAEEPAMAAKAAVQAAAE